MFDSVCLGLSYYKEKRKTAGKETLDGIFFFPVDVPLFTPFTLLQAKLVEAVGVLPGCSAWQTCFDIRTTLF